MTRGRPLRFLALLLGGWIVARVVALMPGAAPPGSVTRSLPAATWAAPAPTIGLPTEDRPTPRSARSAVAKRAPPEYAGIRPIRSTAQPPSASWDIAPQPLAAASPPRASIMPAPLAAPLPARAGRLRIDAWLIARGRGGAALLTPQLGGSQAGVRASFALGGPALFARAATPLGPGPAEAAVGVQQAIPRTPVTAYVELRKLAGVPVAPVVGGFGGIDRRVLGLRVTGYGQGGYTAGRANTFFADGQLAASYDLRRIGPATLSAGVGVWGAAQRGASRIDLGPSIAVRRGAVRVGLDWRVRVVGDARPNSGPALTVAAGF